MQKGNRVEGLQKTQKWECASSFTSQKHIQKEKSWIRKEETDQGFLSNTWSFTSSGILTGLEKKKKKPFNNVDQDKLTKTS